MVEAEVQLTHCKKIVIEACKVYVLAGIELVRTGNAKKAYEKARDYIENSGLEQLQKEWWEDCVENGDWIVVKKNTGQSKIAWTYTFRYLKDWNEKYKNRVNEAYYEILREVMKRGGDTDTNACIVGAFIGALVGFAKIPKLYRENFLNCDVI